MVARRTPVLSHVQATAHPTATTPSTVVVGRAPNVCAVHPVTRLETVSVSVMSAASKAKIRPRIRSGTIRCSP